GVDRFGGQSPLSGAPHRVYVGWPAARGRTRTTSVGDRLDDQPDLRRAGRDEHRGGHRRARAGEKTGRGRTPSGAGAGDLRPRDPRPPERDARLAHTPDPLESRDARRGGARTRHRRYALRRLLDARHTSAAGDPDRAWRRGGRRGPRPWAPEAGG